MKFRVATLNIGTIRGKSAEIVETLSRSIDFCCIQEHRWKGASVRKIVGKDSIYKFFWVGNSGGFGGVGVGHTLDIIATLGIDPSISNIKSNECDVSHHFLEDFQAEVIPDVKQEKEISYRSLKNINAERFLEEVVAKLDISFQSFRDNIRTYNQVLSDLIDEHAPMKTRILKIVPNAPRSDGGYANMRKQRRKAEKKFKKTKLLVDKVNYINLRKKTIELAYQKKCKQDCILQYK